MGRTIMRNSFTKANKNISRYLTLANLILISIITVDVFAFNLIIPSILSFCLLIFSIIHSKAKEKQEMILKILTLALFITYFINLVFLYSVLILSSFLFSIKLLFTLKYKINIKRKLNHAMSQFQNYLVEGLVIDSNIWMNERYEPFFDVLLLACKNKNHKIELLASQFDEISNIKKKSDYKDPTNRRARLAISRIERFQKENLLTIQRITVDAKNFSYADPEIVTTIISMVKKGVECIFISDDIELRIRVREHLAQLNASNWEIVLIETALDESVEIIKLSNEVQGGL